MMGGKTSENELKEVIRHIALLTRLGYPLAEGLKAMGEKSPMLSKLGEEVERGDSLSEAMRRHPRVFSPFYAALVEAAEIAERTGHILSDLGRLLERTELVRSKVRGTLLYPIVLANAFLLQMIFFTAFIFPRVIIPLWNTIQQHYHVTNPLTPAITSALPVITMTAVTILLFLDYAAFRDEGLFTGITGFIPWIRSFQLVAEQAIWARSLGNLLAAGVALPRALKLSTGLVRLPAMRHQIEDAAEKIERGSSIDKALTDASSIEELKWSFNAGEAQENLPEALIEAADNLDSTLDRLSAISIQMLEPWALAGIGIFVLIGFLSYWWPFYSLISHLP